MLVVFTVMKIVYLLNFVKCRRLRLVAKNRRWGFGFKVSDPGALSLRSPSTDAATTRRLNGDPS